MFILGIGLAVMSGVSFCLGIYSFFADEDMTIGKGFNRSGPFTWFFVYGLLAWVLLDM